MKCFLNKKCFGNIIHTNGNYGIPVRHFANTADILRKMSSLELMHLKRSGKRIAMITAYDFPSV
jgi:hypothetical protein